MSYGTYTETESRVFTITHARYLATKVATDLKRMQRFYGKPSDRGIDQYEREVIVLLKGDYMDRIEYGFRTKDRKWRVAIKYEARSGGVLIADDDPGRIQPNIDIRGCYFTSFLVTNYNWHYLSPKEQKKIYKEAGVNFTRKAGEEPKGPWRYDKTYSAGGRGVIRSSIKNK